MIKLLNHLAQAWHLSSAHYWHLRMLSALLLVPLLGVLYIVLFDRPRRPKPSRQLWHR